MKNNSHTITECAVIAALYVILTFISELFGISNGVIQCRLSEALYAFAIFTPSAVWGLSVGCFLANILTGCSLLDIIFGSIATFIGAYFSHKLRNKPPVLALLPPILSNTVIIPLVLKLSYGLPGNVWYFMLTVGLGEIVSCGIFGMVLISILKKQHNCAIHKKTG